MSGPLDSDHVAAAFRDSCLLELDALKPGNVHRHAGGHQLAVEQFELSAVAAAPFIADASLGVGPRIRKAAEATALVARSNTNLGILLLCAPLAAAAEMPTGADLRTRTADILAGLTVDDAVEAYEGIRVANAGGLGTAEAQDVSEKPSVTLLSAMAAAEGRDRIAWNYTHQFADIFDHGSTRLEAAAARFGDSAWAVTALYLGFLASLHDTLIARKFGAATAEEVRAEAAPLAQALAESDDAEALRPALLQFDARLKARRLNPGTSADLTVATLFTSRLRRLAGTE